MNNILNQLAQLNQVLQPIKTETHHMLGQQKPVERTVQSPQVINDKLLGAFAQIFMGSLTDEQMGKFTKLFGNSIMETGNIEKTKQVFAAAVHNVLSTEEGKEYIQMGADLFLSMLDQQTKKPGN